MISAAEFRKLLPPIYRNALPPTVAPGQRLVIDLEWKRDHPEILECVGVGNRGWVTQWWWQELDEQQREGVRLSVAALVGGHHVIYHNAIADIGVMRMHGFNVTVADHFKLDDTMQAHAVLHSEEKHKLEYLGSQGGKLPEWKHLKDEDPEAYNAGDLVQTDYVWEWLADQFTRDPGAERIYRTQNLPLLPIVIESEEVGLRVNKAKVYPLRDRCAERCDQAVKVAQAYAGYPLNIGSPAQLQDYLYRVEGMPVQYAKAAPGAVGPETTNADAISVLRAGYLDFDGEWEEKNEVTLDYIVERIERGAHPVLEARVLYAGERQILGHYINPCLVFENDDPEKAILGVRDRLYPRIKIHAQASGRHSITDPPMQQLRGELTELVTPEPGTAWLGFDLDQGELRVDAVLTNDEPSIEAFRQGWDIHTLNACDVFGLPKPADLRDPHKSAECLVWRQALGWGGKEDARRTFAKRFVYRLDYGGQAERAGDIPGAKTLGLTPEKLVAASESYLNAHPAKRAWRQQTEAQAERDRISYTFMGRPRRLTGQFKGQRIRAAYNHPHQGAISDINNHLILRIKAALPYAIYKWGAHDSQWWAVPVEKVYEAYSTMREILAQPWDCYGRELVIPSTFKEVRHAA